MNSDELKAMQAPVKERYRDQPESAVVTLKAEGRLGEDLSCSVQTGRALVEAGLHAATGGDGTRACSGAMRRGQIRSGRILRHSLVLRSPE